MFATECWVQQFPGRESIYPVNHSGHIWESKHTSTFDAANVHSGALSSGERSCYRLSDGTNREQTIFPMFGRAKLAMEDTYCSPEAVLGIATDHSWIHSRQAEYFSLQILILVIAQEQV